MSTEIIETSDLLTFEEVAKLLRVSVDHFTRKIAKRGKIRVISISPRKRYIRREDVTEYINKSAGFYK